MVQWNVTVGGTAVETIFDVEYSREKGGTLASATVTAANTDTNRNLPYSADASVERNDEEVLSGVITKKPTRAPGNSQIEFTIRGGRTALSKIEAHRPFYQMDPGEMIRTAITDRAAVRSPETAFRGDGSIDNDWESDAPEFGTVGATEQNLQKRGTDVIGMGFPEGTSGTYYARRNTSLTGDGLVRYTTRFIVNNPGGQFSLEVDLNAYGNNYIWYFDYPASEWTTHKLAAEDAVPDAQIGEPNSQPGTVEYRVDIEGSLPEGRALALDYGEALPFDQRPREQSTPPTSEIQNVGDTITRRHDETVLEMVSTYAQEYGFASYGRNGTPVFEPAGSQPAPKAITYSGTPVVGSSFNRDSDIIRNKVTVQGADDITVTATDSASVDFYGLSEREEQIVDKNIQTVEEAQNRAEGYLEDHAWEDTTMEFEIADATYTNVYEGQAIQVSWPPEDLPSGIWTVDSVGQNTAGYAVIGITASISDFQIEQGGGA